jgi:hypothetical protein
MTEGNPAYSALPTSIAMFYGHCVRDTASPVSNPNDEHAPESTVSRPFKLRSNRKNTLSGELDRSRKLDC